jgi:hypothetical protein
MAFAPRSILLPNGFGFAGATRCFIRLLCRQKRGLSQPAQPCRTTGLAWLLSSQPANRKWRQGKFSSNLRVARPSKLCITKPLTKKRM